MENLTPRRMSLDLINVERPCDLDWDSLPGTGSVRVCPRCDKAVHNLSAMRREEAERVVAASADSLCVCYDRDAKGNILTVDYAVPPRRSGRRTRRWVGLGAAIALLAAACQAFLLRPRPPVIRAVGACPPMRPVPASTSGSAVPSNGNGPNGSPSAKHEPSVHRHQPLTDQRLSELNALGRIHLQ